MIKKSTALILLFLLLLQPHDTFATEQNNSSSSNTATFVWISDLHYDAYYGSKDAYSYGSNVCGIKQSRGGIGHQSYPVGTTQNNTNITKIPARGKYGCDSPSSLIEMTLLGARDVLSKRHRQSPLSDSSGADGAEAGKVNDAIMITGDFIRHSTEKLSDPKRNVFDSLAFVANLLRSNFPTPIEIIPAIGNHDVTPGDYLDVDLIMKKQTEEKEVQEDNPLYFQPTAEDTGLDILYHAFASTLLNDATEISSFQNSGSYVRKLPNTNIVILALNTVIYSPFHLPDYSNKEDEEDPLNQFAWMEGELQNILQHNEENSQKQVCWIVGHIPPTIGSYPKTQLWKDSYLIRYHRMIDKYKSIVVSQMFGHLHSDEFRLLSSTSTMLADGDTSNKDTSPLPPLLIQGSVTPVYGSNPNFRVVTYDTISGAILDYDVYYINIDEGSTSSWEKLYSFKDYYGVDDVSYSSLESIFLKMKKESKAEENGESILDQFLDIYRVSSKISQIREETGEDNKEDTCDDVCRLEWLCTLQAMTRKEYDDCVSPPPPLTKDSSPSFKDENSDFATNNDLGAQIFFPFFVLFVLLVFVFAGLHCQSYRRRALRGQYEDVAREFNLDANDMASYGPRSEDGSNIGVNRDQDNRQEQHNKEEEGFDDEEESEEHQTQSTMLSSDDMELL